MLRMRQGPALMQAVPRPAWAGRRKRQGTAPGAGRVKALVKAPAPAQPPQVAPPQRSVRPQPRPPAVQLHPFHLHPFRPVPVQLHPFQLQPFRPVPVQLLHPQPPLHQPRGPLIRSGLLPLFRRISDCLSPLKVFRLEGNTHVPHRGLRDRASYFRENESIVTGCAGAPSVALAPGAIPAAAILVTTSSPDVTLPTTV